MKRVLDYNPLTGESVVFNYDDATDVLTLVHEQDVSGILDQNKALAADTDRTKKQIKDDMLHYASVPNSVILKWQLEKGVDVFNTKHRKKVFKLLNDPEYRYLKTTSITHNFNTDG